MTMLLLLVSVWFTAFAHAAKVKKVKADPPFIWGSAGASYQIEGQVNTDYRSPSIWDVFCAIPGKCYNNETGMPADNDYELYAYDATLAGALGTQSYRLSISWSRILPDGHTINQAGIDHYNAVFDELDKNNQIPFVTMYHWDLPQSIYDATNGGWINEDIIDYYKRYATVLFDNWAPRIKYWLTFNEPWTFCVQGYDIGNHAPGRCSDRSQCQYGNSSTEGYECAHNVLLAHSEVTKLFHEQYAHLNDGVIGITLNGDMAYPMSTSQDDIDAAERNLEFAIGWFADPIYFGDYPQSMKDYVGDRLPTFTQQQSEQLKGCSDFYGMNEYTGKWVANKPNQDGVPDWNTDQQTDVQPINYNGTAIGLEAASSWLWVVPGAIRGVINWISNRYDYPDIYVTENGVDCPNETVTPLPQVLNDTFRINYYNGYINNVLDAIQIDGANIKGYFAWALLDNFEWADAYSKRFGLHYVDYSDPNLTRYRKQSSYWYAEFIANNSNPYNTTL